MSETQGRDESVDRQSNLKPTAGLLERIEGVTRGWRFVQGGHAVPTPAGLVILLERTPGDPATRLGRLEYGAEPKPDGTPSAYDTFIFHELGGAVTLPFCLVDGELHVAVVEQRRFAEVHPEYNPSGKVQNAPRGFHTAGSTAANTAKAEVTQEVGVFEGETVRLPGEPVNVNNSWFSYEDELDGEKKSVRQGGVVLYAMRVNAELLEPTENGRYRIKSEHLGERPKGSPYEMIGNCTFLPWREAIKLRDGFTSIAVARLLGYLG